MSIVWNSNGYLRHVDCDNASQFDNRQKKQLHCTVRETSPYNASVLKCSDDDNPPPNPHIYSTDCARNELGSLQS
jgi:hypothetical protein